MPVRKHNEFLDGNVSEDEYQIDSGSDKEEGRGAIAKASSKRRKLSNSPEFSDEENDDDEVENGEETGTDAEIEENERDATEERGRAVKKRKDDLYDDGNEEDSAVQTSKAHQRMAKQLQASQKAVHKSGVIYLSRVPPFMKPHTLKHFLEPHAPKGIGRIFLTPEDHATHTRRVKSGGNKKRSFTDGWVEFLSKKEAKIAAETLNGNIIGGKKGNFYHDDLWNMKYLKGFKWNHLTEQIANENAERAARLREEIRKTREENRAFVEDIERSKMLEGMERKKKLKGEKSKQGEVATSSKTARDFTQQKARTRRDAEKPSESASGALKMIFG